MRNFSRNDRSERTNDFSRKRGGDYAKPSMHHTTCDSCGKDCEVPFKPTSGKPVFCSNCFGKTQNDSPRKYSSDRSDRSDRNRGDRSDRSDRKFRSGDTRKRTFDDREPIVFHTVCDDCGVDCDVPFKPTSGKPIFCSNCYEKNQNGYQKKSSRDGSDRKFSGGDSRKRSYDDRSSEMYEAVCDSCGDDCEVPFRPTKGKPIYCDNCFGSNKDKGTDQLKEEFEILNKKLDNVLEILTSVLSTKNYHEDSEAETEEPKPEKKTRKKVVTKNEEPKEE